MAAGGQEKPPLGVGYRQGAKKPYFEVRFLGERLFSNKINSVEEGGLCFDIAKLYESDLAQGAPGDERGKRKVLLKLNYPVISKDLVLEDLPPDFDIKRNKNEAMAIILRQAQVVASEAKNLLKQAQAAPKSRAKVQKHSAQDVGSQIINNRRSRQQNDRNSLVRGAKDYLDSLIDICEHMRQCKHEKVREREELERKVKDIKEDSGIIDFQKPGPEKFSEHMASFKQLLDINAHHLSRLEACEQDYKSEESKCCKLRKILEDHNLKSIPESLLIDGNRMTGRQRANEQERLPSVLEKCSIEEQNTSNMPTGVSAFCASPTSPLVLDVVAYGEDDIAMPSVVEMDKSHPIASLGDKYSNEEIQNLWDSLEAQTPTHTSYRRENGDERLADICVNNNAEVQSHDPRSQLDWTNIALYHTDLVDFPSCELDSSEVHMFQPQM